MATIDGGEVLVRGLEAEGVRALFAITDFSYAPVLRSAEAHGLRIVGPRHESAAVHMAEGWARATGEVAVAMAGMGPGVANLVPGVFTAWIEGFPVLVIGTQRTERADRSIRRGRFQHTPQLDVFRSITKLAASVPDARRIPEYVREAFRVALSGRPGPVYLEFPAEVLREPVETEAAATAAPARYRARLGDPDPAALASAAEQLAAASLPLIVAGQGVQWSGAWEPLRDLAEHLGALVITSPGARGVLPEDHPQAVRFLLGQAPGGARAAREADVVLAVGTEVGETLGYGRPPHWGDADAQRWIHLDVDPASIGVNREVDLALVGDARVGLRSLLEGVKGHRAAREPSAAARACVAADRTRPEALEAAARSDASPVHPARLASEVAAFLPRDAIACLDGGNTTLWAHHLFRIRAPRSLLWTSHFGHLGTGLPYAIAAQLARPQCRVVLYSGDSAFGFNLQELETAAREDVRILAVVACDYAWGMEVVAETVEIGKPIGAHTSRVRYDEVARALGCHGEFVTQAEEIRPALARASEAGRPAVVQVEVDPEANGNPPGLIEFAQMYDARDA